MISDLLSRGGLDVRKAHSRPNEIWVNCPFCVERGESPDTRFRLSLNIQSGKGNCFNCGWRSHGMRRTVVELSRVLRVRISPPRPERLRQEAENGQETGVTEPVPTGLPEGYERFHDADDPVERLARDYLKSRGISILQIVRHQIGYAAVGKMAYRILFPVIGSDKKIYGCVGRTFDKHGKPKYLNTPGIKLLWNAHRTAAEVVVVEGVTDALKVEQALLTVRNSIAVARLGSTITNLQLAQLKQFEKITILPDHDRPGVQGASKLADVCIGMHMRVSVAVPERMDGCDPGSMSVEDILNELGNARPWTTGLKARLRESANRHKERCESNPLLLRSLGASEAY